jgi:short-subunit dehydrogenase
MPPKVFITGASSGIGSALARHYAALGATLGLAARRDEPMRELADSLTTPVSIYALDVTDCTALATAAQDFIAHHGVPDIVIANAGVSTGTRGDLAADVAVLSHIMHTNVVGLATTLQAFVAPMRERSSGVLVGIASVAGFRGLAGAGAYCASKSAAITWLEALRLELRGSGVDVVTICPGYVATPLTAANRHPMPFLLQAPEAARLIASAIRARKRLAVIPWQMRLVFFVLRRMPSWLYDRLFAHAPRKPRDRAT